MAKKATAKKAASKKKAVKKPAKKAAKKASKKHQLIIEFTEEKDGIGVQITGKNISPQMMAMGHEALRQAIVEEMTGISPKKS